nr:hypothetical protein [Cylindrospermopsis raciborskii]
MRSHFSVGSGTGLSRRRSVIRQLTRRLGGVVGATGGTDPAIVSTSIRSTG